MRHACTRCHSVGHFANRCEGKEVPRTCTECGGKFEMRSNAAGWRCEGCINRSRRRGFPSFKQCGYCGEPNHNIRTCAVKRCDDAQGGRGCEL